MGGQMGTRTTVQIETLRGIDPKELTWVIAGIISVPDYQRPPQATRVKKIADEFDPDKYDPLKLSRRADGSLWVIDGNHRLQAIMSMGWGDQLVPARVIQGLTYEQEAALFVAQKDRRDPDAAERFAGRLEQREPTALDMLRVAEEVGVILDYRKKKSSGEPHVIYAISSAEAIYRDGRADRFRLALSLINRAWGETPGAFVSEVLGGMNTFLARYEKRLDLEQARKAFARVTLDEALRSASSMRHMFREDARTCLGRALLHIYNNGLRTHRLPGWDEVNKFGNLRVEGQS